MKDRTACTCCRTPGSVQKSPIPAKGGHVAFHRCLVCSDVVLVVERPGSITYEHRFEDGETLLRRRIDAKYKHVKAAGGDVPDDAFSYQVLTPKGWKDASPDEWLDLLSSLRSVRKNFILN